MSVTITDRPRLVQPAGSHWLELNAGSGDEPFSREELYPILELEAPRGIGLVRARFAVDRYVASSWDERMGTSSPVWTEWRLVLREVMTPDPERPDLPHLGQPAAGIGAATYKAIRDACEPLIREWLASDEYPVARRAAVYYAACREIDAPADYRIRRGRELVEKIDAELDAEQAGRLDGALNLLDNAYRLIEDGKR